MTVDKEQLLHNARSLAEAGQHDDARRCLLELLQREPDNQAALIMLGALILPCKNIQKPKWYLNN